MKLNILTLYSSWNMGTFLQAYSMQRLFSDMGYEVEFINTGSPSLVTSMRTLIGALRHKGQQSLAFSFRQLQQYKQSLRKLNISPERFCRNHCSYDMLVIGGDEIWNCLNPTFVHMPEYWGDGVNAKRVVAYAPSCGQAGYDDLITQEYVKRGLLRFDYLSVRDRQSAEIVRRLSGREATLVIDPTMMVDLSDVQILPEATNYILVYAYSLDNKQIDECVKFAHNRGKQLWSIGQYYEWCDRQLAVSPFEFLGLVNKADHVITDTFHGTVFSIIFRKNFGVFAGIKAKVHELLEKFALQDRCIDDKTPLESVLLRDIDYSSVERIWQSLARDSIKFIRRSLCEKPQSTYRASGQ